MADPIAHSLLGIATVRLTAYPTAVPQWRWYIFAIIAANAADLDFFAGLALGDINLFHRQASHSLLMAASFGIISALFARWLNAQPLRVFIAGTLAYASHLLLDHFCQDGRPPAGQPLLWPFSDQHWLSTIPLFSGIRHGDSGDSMVVVFREIVSTHNLYAIGLDLLILLPITLFTIYVTRDRWAYSSEQ